MGRSFSGLLLFMSLFFLGCGQSGPRIVKVHGTVTHQGRAVANIIVKFMPDEGRPSWGLTDKEGRYNLHYDRSHEGALIGKQKVWVEYRPMSPKEEMEGNFRIPKNIESILEKYGDKQNPALTVDIEKENQVVDLALD
jgi:hypothetical protein